ncbi:MAG: phosphoribosylamine--glycine ligase [Firmicutes bacterium]|nr:phosphoribosylamine--glycine ligase [Bacillota bacterium]
MKRNVLVIGSGGREHAVCHTLARSENIGRIYAAPGNAGIAAMPTAECVDIKTTDLNGILEFVRAHDDIYMTVVTPDDPLSMGLVDLLNQNGFRAFGPTAAAAKIESSKAFAKELMRKYDIPTADYRVFDEFNAALTYITGAKYPLVIKADGLALGKGVVICKDFKTAENALREIMLDKKFGAAGASVVVEEFLYGEEVSVLVFTDGQTIKIMPTSRDYKRAKDGDKGLNTGGMGAFSPVTEFEDSKCNFKEIAMNSIFMPTIHAMNKEGRLFRGILYFGLMVTAGGVKVLEYNARFGDPETQVILPGLKTDLLEVFDACIDGKLGELDIEWDGKYRVCVVAASKGYPLSYEKGKKITIKDGEGLIFHAGTAIKDGELVTNGGRVLCAVGEGDLLSEACNNAYANLKRMTFEGMIFRRDIVRNAQ